MNKMGFGFLRLPRADGGTINNALLNQMVDAFLERGGVYFDTAYTYLDGQSETALRDALVNRYPREQFQIADVKLYFEEYRSNTTGFDAAHSGVEIVHATSNCTKKLPQPDCPVRYASVRGSLGMERTRSAAPHSTSWPSRKKAAQSPALAACRRSWVTSTMV